MLLERTTRNVNIISLKNWVHKNLPYDSSLKELILVEADVLAADDFLSKMGTWLTLLDIEKRSIIQE